MDDEHEKLVHANDETLKAFIRRVVKEEMHHVVREEVESMLREQSKTRGWTPLRPGPQETK